MPASCAASYRSEPRAGRLHGRAISASRSAFELALRRHDLPSTRSASCFPRLQPSWLHVLVGRRVSSRVWRAATTSRRLGGSSFATTADLGGWRCRSNRFREASLLPAQRHHILCPRCASAGEDSALVNYLLFVATATSSAFNFPEREVPAERWRAFMQYTARHIRELGELHQSDYVLQDFALPARLRAPGAVRRRARGRFTEALLRPKGLSLKEISRAPVLEPSAR